MISVSIHLQLVALRCVYAQELDSTEEAGSKSITMYALYVGDACLPCSAPNPLQLSDVLARCRGRYIDSLNFQTAQQVTAMTFVAQPSAQVVRSDCLEDYRQNTVGRFVVFLKQVRSKGPR